MRSLLVLLITLGALVVATRRTQEQASGLSDVRSDAASILRKAPGVARVERLVSVRRPTRRIIHIADYHWISRDDLAADLRDQHSETTEADIDAEYERIMTEVRCVQAKQLRFIRWLAKEHSVRAIHIEGLTDRDDWAYAALVRLVGKGNVEPERIGAAGQALASGEIEAVLPAEDEAAYLAAGVEMKEQFVFDGPRNEARKAAIAERLIASGPLSIVVLGAADDLSKHVPAGCEYLRVFVDGYQE